MDSAKEWVKLGNIPARNMEYSGDGEVDATCSRSCLEGSPSGKREAQTWVQISKASSFQTAKLAGSTTVGWMISLAGKTPQVTALTSAGPTLETLWLSLFTAM